MKIHLLFLFVLISSFAIGQDLNCPLKIKVRNSSKYQINKLLIFGKQLDSLSSGSVSNILCIDKLYSNAKFDITFSKRKKWKHIIQQPIDIAGEKFITEGAFEISFYIKKTKAKRKFEAYYKIT